MCRGRWRAWSLCCWRWALDTMSRCVCDVLGGGKWLMQLCRARKLKCRMQAHLH
jgi:hypothetical protein